MRIYKYERKLASIKLITNRYALATAALTFKNSIRKYKSLFDFLNNTLNSIDVDESQFLKLFRKFERTNSKRTQVNEVDLKAEIISIIEKKTYDKGEADIVKSFIVLQESLLILKSPLKYFYVKFKIWIAHLPVKIAFVIFKICCTIMIKLNLVQTNEIKKEFGNAIFICQIQRKYNHPKIVSKTGQGRIDEIKQFNQIGVFGY